MALTCWFSSSPPIHLSRRVPREPTGITQWRSNKARWAPDGPLSAASPWRSCDPSGSTCIRSCGRFRRWTATSSRQVRWLR